MPRSRYALRLMYDGGAFRGFQRQPGLATVQDALEGALANVEPGIRVQPAARTDAGVHAVGQVVTFSSRAADLDPAWLRAVVNAHTPPTLVCLDAARVAPDVHARASALLRRYVYLVGWPAPPELCGWAWSLPDPRAFPDNSAESLDTARVAAALSFVVGEHDFAGFARPGDQTAKRARDARATVTTITRAELIPSAVAPFAAIVLEGRSFLRAMARHLVGTVVAAGVGVVEPSRVAEILALPGARYRGVRAPGWGLTLACVAYRRPLFGGGAPARTAPRRSGTPEPDPEEP